ncbi:MAG: leucine-rich repeat protein [Mycoplasma sp.]
MSFEEGSQITEIGENAFFKCQSLNNVIFPKKLKFINNYAFGNCTSLTTLNIPSTVNILNIRCFQECKNLKNINTFWTTEEVNNLRPLRASFADIESLTINYFVNENDDADKLLEVYKAKFTLERTLAKHVEFRRANPNINIGAILGGVFGLIAAIGLIAGGVVFYNKKHNKK